MTLKKSKDSHFLIQAMILVLAGFIARFIGFLYRIPMQGILGDEGTGIYAHGYNIYSFFFVLSSAGLPAAVSRMVSSRVAIGRYKGAYKVFKVSLCVSTTVGFICSSIMFFGAATIASYLKNQDATLCIKVLSPAVFIVAIMSVYRGYFQGMGSTLPTAISQIIEQIVNAIFSVYLSYIFINKGFAEAAGGGTAGSTLGSLAGLITIFIIYLIYRAKIHKKVINDTKHKTRESSLEICKELFSTAIPIIAGTAIFSMTNLIDSRMVYGILQNNGFSYTETKTLFGQLNGKYVVLTTLPVAISTAISTAIVPSIASSIVKNDKRSVNKKINMALRLTMIISIPASIGLGVLANQILQFIFPNNPDGGILLKVGAISVIFLSLSQIATGILQGIGKVQIPAFAAFCGVIVKIPLNYFLISSPKLNIIGAVIGTTICYVISSNINLQMVRRITKIKIDFISIFLKPIFSSVIMGLICYITYNLTYYIFSNNAFSLIISIIFGMIFYFIFMLIIKGIKKQDLENIPMGRTIYKKLSRFGII